MLSTFFDVLLYEYGDGCDYYKRLKKIEDKAEKYWNNKDKPSLFL